MFLFFFSVYASNAQDAPASDRDRFRVLFYNVENLFDTKDDPATRDEEFLPLGERFWTAKRLNSKLIRIAQVIAEVGEWNPPALIGLCEVENQYVIEKLLSDTYLVNSNYQVIHKESPDPRGIDVALLYRENFFSPISFLSLEVNDPEDKSYKTREILYVRGLSGGDTLHVFVNHWPSKYGGVAGSEQKRFLAAKLLRTCCDSIFLNNSEAKILIMGDFNDNPSDPSLAEVLKASPPEKEFSQADVLYNLAYPLWQDGKGSHKYQAHWGMLDQMIVSGALLKSKHGGIFTKPGAFTLFTAPFLLEPDPTHLGEKPNRTYMGFKYHNGFSDHLPVFLDLWKGLPAN